MSESSSAESHDDDGDRDDELCHGFSSTSSEEEYTQPGRRHRMSSTRDDILDEERDEHQEAQPHAPPNSPNNTPPTDAAQEARPSEEQDAAEAQGSSPKRNRSGRQRDQMPYKPRRYKGKRGR